MTTYAGEKNGVLTKDIEHAEDSFFAKIGDKVVILDKIEDPLSPSGESYLVEFGYTKRLYYVDCNSILTEDDWNRIYRFIANDTIDKIAKFKEEYIR